MEATGVGLLVVLVEAILVLGIVVVFFFRHTYRLRRRLAILEKERGAFPAPGVRDFLDREIERTASLRVAWREGGQDSPPETRPSLPVGMDARLATLEAERQWLDRQEGAEGPSAEEIERIYGALVRRLAQVLLSNPEERESLFEVGDVDVEKLVRECDVALQIVRSRVRNLVVEEEIIAMLMTKLDRIAAINRELSYCIVTQMDENRFLREQVAALVHEG